MARRVERSEAEELARLQEEVLRQEALRDNDTEQDTADRQVTDEVCHRVTRSQATGEERLECALYNRLFHQVNIINETEDETHARRRANRTQNDIYRVVESEQQMAERRE